MPPASSLRSRPQSRKRKSEDEDSDADLTIDEITCMTRKEKNRIAARRHRMMRKVQDQLEEQRLIDLTQRNLELKELVGKFREEIKSIKSALINRLPNVISA